MTERKKSEVIQMSHFQGLEFFFVWKDGQEMEDGSKRGYLFPAWQERMANTWDNCIKVRVQGDD